MSPDPSIRSQRARTTGSRVIPATMGELPALVERAVDGNRQLTVDKTHATSVELYRRTNWLTWGENLIADFSPVDVDRTLVTVSSRPTFALQVQDWGQSAKDVEALLDAISAAADGSSPPPTAAVEPPHRHSTFRRQAPIGIVLVAAAASIVVGTMLADQH